MKTVNTGKTGNSSNARKFNRLWGWFLCGSDSELQILVWSRKKVSLVQNRNRLLVRRWCSGHAFFCACESAVRFLDSENSNQRRLLLRPAPSRVHFPRPWTRAPKPMLRLYLLRDLPRRFTWYFFSARHPSPARELLAALCVLAWYVATKDVGWVRCSPCSLGPSPRRPTAA